MMLWVLTLVFAGPQLGDRVELFAGEDRVYVAPCFDAKVAAADKKVSVVVKGPRVHVSATVPVTSQLAVRCGAQEKTVAVNVKPLPDLFDGQAPGELPGAPQKLELRMGERRAFNPSCQVTGMSGKGNAADAELSLIRVLIIEAKEVGRSVLELTCDGGKKKSVDVSVMP